MENQLTEIACQMIAFVGSAKSSFIEALRAANRNDVATARQIYDEGMKDFAIAYENHEVFLTKFANGEKIDTNILIIHAECSLMSAEDFKALAEEAIALAELRVAK